jgi:hypothetical protein
MLAQIVLGEAAALLLEVVIEAVVDRGADGDVRAGKEALHRVGHHVSGRVADDARPPGSVSRIGVSGIVASMGVWRSTTLPFARTATTCGSSVPSAWRRSRGVSREDMGRLT